MSLPSSIPDALRLKLLDSLDLDLSATLRELAIDDLSFGLSEETLAQILNQQNIDALTGAVLETAIASLPAAVSFINQLPETIDKPDPVTAFFRSTFFGNVFDRLISDIPEGATAFTTLTKSGQPIDNGNSQAIPLKWTNTDNNSTVVTFAFQDGFQLNGIDTDRAKTLFKGALQTWATYAPLEFIETKDPGNGDAVDIWVQSDGIDGKGKTLAFAFFPSVGDITFDTGETWNEAKFLETAVHELGHSLGLDHEDDTPAIMNSVLANRFKNGAFLLEDDIAGIRNLYGTGQGSVKALGSKPDGENGSEADYQAVPLGPNLVTNGSFETISIGTGEFGLYKSVTGWKTLSGVGFRVDKRTQVIGPAAAGEASAALDIYNTNSTIAQNIDTLTGQTYTLSVDYSNGGENSSTSGIDVYWGGKRVDGLTGGGKGRWSTHTYLVTGDDRETTTLAFRATGPSDNISGLIDNISVRAGGMEQLLQESIALGSADDQASTGLPDSFASALMASDLLSDKSVLVNDFVA
ncbi:MAG: matrixin family metalloprotease [Phormidesmis sp.]